jgi:hypothetical protein
MSNVKKSSSESKPSPQKKVRLLASEKPGVGNSRYELLRAVADRTRTAMEAGFYLEATTLVESLLTERLEKRVQWLYQNPPTPAAKGSLEKLKDGFKTIHVLIVALKATETDSDMRTVLDPIDVWSKSRNEAIHEMAKLGHGAEKSWDERYLAAQQAAVVGIKLVLELDQHERRVCHTSRNKRNASATCPDALLALGQPWCEWCV